MVKKIKIEIKSWLNGSVLFEYEAENNTMAKTVQAAVSEGADLSYANLSSANLRSANLSYANLSSADLSYANLSSANLSSADLSYANLSGVPFDQLPEFWVNLCSRDMLFVMQHLKQEVPTLKEKLLAGEVDGSQYEGDCACLIGTLGNADGGKEKVCSAIPYYTMSADNPGETWFLSIHRGDTPKDNDFSKHAVQLCNEVLGLDRDDGIDDEETKKVETVEINGKKYNKTELDERLKELEPVEA